MNEHKEPEAMIAEIEGVRLLLFPNNEGSYTVASLRWAWIALHELQEKDYNIDDDDEYEGDEESVTYVRIPSNYNGTPISAIMYRAFESYTNLKKIDIEDGIEEIGDQAFGGCEKLTEITIPKSLKSIGKMAFMCCGSLAAITIPRSVTSIDYGAFAFCESLTINCEVSSEPAGWRAWNPFDRPVNWGVSAGTEE